MKSRVDFLNNSDGHMLAVLRQSSEYLEAHSSVLEQLVETVRVYRALTDLIPEPVEKVFSGHLFPQVEAESELESSIALCKLGFYKHAISTLRNLLELGLLSVYWDVDGQSHIEIQEWLRSNEPTPFKKDLHKKLKSHPNIHKFDGNHGLFRKTYKLFDDLSNFTHTRGVKHSAQRLGKSNVNTFNEKSLLQWLEFLTRVVKIVTTFHVLRYPVGLQYTPIDDKFGLNGPAGGFLQPFQMELIKKLLHDSGIDSLQEISDSCPEAKSLAEWVNEKPDITEEEVSAQAEHFENQMKNWGGKAEPTEH